MRRFLYAALLAASIPVAADAAPLSFEDAVALAIARSPSNDIAAARRDMLGASRRGADTRPAAAIEVTAENLGYSRDALNQSQIDLLYARRIERGGKRAARIALVDREVAVAEAEATVTRLDIVALVQKHYVEVQAAAIALDVARERLELARIMKREVDRRVSAARDPIFAGTRAAAMLAEMEVAVEVAVHERDRCIQRLVALWGGTADGVEIAHERFLTVSHDEVEHLPSPPDLALYEARTRQADAAVTLERAAAVVDPTISAGPRVLTGTGDVALVAGLTLPLSNRSLNRANIDRAEAGRRQAEASLALERFQRERAIDTAAEEVEEAQHATLAIRDRVIPMLQQTLVEVRAGYARGGFSFLDVSTAANALADARERMIAAATRFHLAEVTLDRLTGIHMNLVGEAR